MNSYIKLDTITNIIVQNIINNRKTSVADLVDIKTIEVSEDAISRYEVVKALRLEYPCMPLFKELRDEWQLKSEGYLKAEEIIRNAPSVIPQPKEGKWFIREYEYFTCDQCGEDVESHAESTQEAKTMLENGDFPNFCPNCGAKMKRAE